MSATEEAPAAAPAASQPADGPINLMEGEVQHGEKEPEGGLNGNGVMEEGAPSTLNSMAEFPICTDAAQHRFMLRGPNYLSNPMAKLGGKQPSLPAVYTFHSFECFSCPQRVHHLCRLWPPPAAPPGMTPSEGGLPRRLVVHLQIPGHAPNLVEPVIDGKGWSLVFFFTASTETLQQWQEGGSPASQLFTRWADSIRRKGNTNQELDDPHLREGLFKIVALLENMREAGLGSVLEGMNGKPALATKSAMYFCGEDYIEMTINFHRFCWAARKAFHVLVGKSKGMVVNMAFLLEGQREEDLPEQVVAAVRINKLDFWKMPPPLDPSALQKLLNEES